MCRENGRTVSYTHLDVYKRQMVGLATDTPKVLTDVQVIRGKEKIVRELEGKQA